MVDILCNKFTILLFLKMCICVQCASQRNKYILFEKKKSGAGSRRRRHTRRRVSCTHSMCNKAKCENENINSVLSLENYYNFSFFNAARCAAATDYMRLVVNLQCRAWRPQCNL